MRRFRTVLIGSSVAVAAAGVLSGAPSASAAPTVAASGAGAAAESADAVLRGVRWGACSSDGLKSAGAVCGYLTVPLDYRHPKGATIKIALSMVKHKVPRRNYQGIMLVNPGGPGGSGLGLSVLGSYVPNHAGDAYDWIGFDPRGVGSSIPAISCDPNYFAGPRPPYEPTTAAIENAWLARSKGYAAACAKNGAILDHVKTPDVARDLDSIRSALGQKQLNYYGFSYGTYLGQVYATLFPQRVRRMVLDANVDPRRVWYAANLDQDVAFEKVVKIWFAWVAKYDKVYHLGKTEKAVEARFYQEKAALTKAPAGGVVGPDEWTDIFLSVGYTQFAWEPLAQLWATWNKDHKDAKPLVDAANNANGVGDDNLFAVYNAVQCTDAAWPKSWSTWKKDNTRVAKIAPFETWGNVWFNAPCLFWPAKSGTPVKVNGAKVPPILLVDETLDAATPYSGSLQVRKLFPKASLLALPGGTSHANSLNGNACEDNLIAAYLKTGALPKRVKGAGPDATCKPLPVPDPTKATPASSSAQAPALVQALLPARLAAVRG